MTLKEEFSQDSDRIVSKKGFDVTLGGWTEPVKFHERGTTVSFSSEWGQSGIILFASQTSFPDGTTAEEERRIFECVVRAIWFSGAKVEVEYGSLSAEAWELPPRPPK